MNWRTVARGGAMSLWVSSRHLSFDDDLGALTGTAVSYEDFQHVKFGSLINV